MTKVFAQIRIRGVKFFIIVASSYFFAVRLNYISKDTLKSKIVLIKYFFSPLSIIFSLSLFIIIILYLSILLNVQLNLSVYINLSKKKIDNQLPKYL